jgi:hypothetical protein
LGRFESNFNTQCCRNLPSEEAQGVNRTAMEDLYPISFIAVAPSFRTVGGFPVNEAILFIL